MITVWRIPLDPAVLPAADRIVTLSAEERARADRFRFERDRNKWLQSHIAIRHILASELGVKPAEICYAVGPNGKPSLAISASSPDSDSRLEFNFSDSGNLGLLALTYGTELGVDVEQIAPIEDITAIAESHFADEEQRALFALPESEQTIGFYRLWTRKEAYIKAVGIGLSHPLDQFAVTLDQHQPRFVHIDGDESLATEWSLADLSVGDGYVGSVAVRQLGIETRTEEWRS